MAQRTRSESGLSYFTIFFRARITSRNQQSLWTTEYWLKLHQANPSILAYADDIIVVCESLSLLDTIFKELILELRGVGLEMNQNECAIIIRDPQSTVTPPPRVLLNNIPIEVVSIMRYLGIYLTSGLDRKSTVAARIKSVVHNPPSRQTHTPPSSEISSARKIQSWETMLHMATHAQQRHRSQRHEYLAINNRKRKTAYEEMWISLWSGWMRIGLNFGLRSELFARLQLSFVE